MDSLTQALLGAATFAAVKDKDLGSKSLLIGAIAGTIPDLDVLLAPFYNEIEFLSIHRGLSHSIFVAIGLSVILGEFGHRLSKQEHSRRSWMLAFFLALVTHSLLDCCTSFGTQIFSPFSSQLVAWNFIHVFEPTYTLILAVGLVLLFTVKKKARARQSLLRSTLLVSTAFLCWTVVSKALAKEKFTTELKIQGIEYEEMMLAPTPFNSILWHGIVKTSSGYCFGTYSLFDEREHITFFFEESANEALDQLRDLQLVQVYLAHTDGFPLVKVDEEGNIRIYSVKYGPVNYQGQPEFLYPMVWQKKLLQGDAVFIDFSSSQKGPVKDYQEFFRRIKGI